VNAKGAFRPCFDPGFTRQLPTWLRDPETYAAWRRGEVNGPKMEKREAASAGKTALADLDEADRVELGGVVQGSVSQTQSVMRKQAIRNMRAPQLLDALQAHGVVFSPVRSPISHYVVTTVSYQLDHHHLRIILSLLMSPISVRRKAENDCFATDGAHRC
jgi:hypothetical protein